MKLYMSLTPSQRTVSYIIKPLVFITCLLPFVLLIYNAIGDNLGANPVEAMTHATGGWTLKFLLITLAVTPLRKILKISWLLKFRRMLGLFAFFYALLHLLTYVWFDQNFDWIAILKDIPKRPFITIGFAAFVLLIPLAMTSTNAMMRRLKKRWVRLHKLIYLIPILGIIHFIWSVKADIFEPLMYTLILVVLFSYRVFIWKQAFLLRLIKKRSIILNTGMLRSVKQQSYRIELLKQLLLSRMKKLLFVQDTQ